MSPDEYERIKEAEKEHLRKIRKLKELAKQAERRNKVSGAVGDMASSLESLLDEHREMTDRLTRDAALQEARLEISLEAAEARADAADLEAADEETLASLRAKETVARMKGTPSGTPEKSSVKAPEKTPSEPPPPMPEKTIGRMKR